MQQKPLLLFIWSTECILFVCFNFSPSKAVKDVYSTSSDSAFMTVTQGFFSFDRSALVDGEIWNIHLACGHCGSRPANEWSSGHAVLSGEACNWW